MTLAASIQMCKLISKIFITFLYFQNFLDISHHADSRKQWEICSGKPLMLTHLGTHVSINLSLLIMQRLSNLVLAIFAIKSV